MKTSMNVRTQRCTVVQTPTAQTRMDHSFVTVTIGTSECPAGRSDATVSVDAHYSIIMLVLSLKNSRDIVTKSI